MNRVAATLVIAALSLSAGTVTAFTTAPAAPAAPGSGSPKAGLPRQEPASGISIELIEQDFTIGVNDELRLVYLLRGDIESAADLAPATTTTTTSTTTSSTTTTVPPVPDPADVGGVPPVAPPIDEAATTTTTTVPAPREITIDVANFAPITDMEQADDLLGTIDRPGSFRGNIDGVRLADARSAIEVIDATTARLTISLPTDTGRITGDDAGDGAGGSGPGSLEFPTPGIHPIRLQLLVDGDLVGTHGTLVDRRSGPDDTPRPFAPVQFAIVTALDAQVIDAISPPLPDDAERAGLTEALDAIDVIIDAAARLDPSIFVSVPPNLLIAAVARSATDTATDTDTNTDTNTDEAAAGPLADDELAALSDIDLDVSSAVAAGLDAQYTQALGRGEDEIITALSRTPTRLIRIVDRPISASGAQLLSNIGVQALLMTPDRYDSVIGGPRPDTDRLVDVALPDGDTLPLLLTDPASNDFSTAAADRALADATPTEWAIETVAGIVLDHRSQGRNTRRTRVLALSRFRPPDPRLVNALDAMAATTPDVRLIAPTELIGTTDTQRPPDGDALVLPEVAGPDLTVRLGDIETTKLNLASAESMIGDDDGRFSDWTEQLDALLSTGVNDDEAAAVIAGITAEADAVRASVEVTSEPFTFTLTGQSDTIPIRLSNTSNQRVRVIVNLSSPTLTFPGNDRLVVLRPNDSTDIQVPVRARSNGTSPVTVQLLTPLGEPLGESLSLTARVNSLTGLGQVLTGGFLLMLAAWWFANWRSRRRDADDEYHVETTDGAPDVEPDTDADVGPEMAH